MLTRAKLTALKAESANLQVFMDLPSDIQSHVMKFTRRQIPKHDPRYSMLSRMFKRRKSIHYTKKEGHSSVGETIPYGLESYTTILGRGKYLTIKETYTTDEDFETVMNAPRGHIPTLVRCIVETGFKAQPLWIDLRIFEYPDTWVRNPWPPRTRKGDLWDTPFEFVDE